MEPDLLEAFNAYRIYAEKAYEEWKKQNDSLISHTAILPEYTKLNRYLNQGSAVTGRYLLKGALKLRSMDAHEDTYGGHKYGGIVDYLVQMFAKFGLKEWNRVFLPTYQQPSHLNPVFFDQIAILSKSVLGGFESWRKRFHPNCSIKASEKACRVTWFALFWSVLHGRTSLSNMELENIWNYSMLYPYVDDFLDSPEDRYRIHRKQFILDLRHSLSPNRPIYEFYYHPMRANFTECLRIVKRAITSEGPPANKDIVAALEVLTVVEEIGSQSAELKEVKPEADLIFHSCMKGSLAILPVCTLITGSLSPQDLEQLFKHGLAFQLLDDLQDIEEDRLTVPYTLFTNGPREHQGTPDSLVIKTLNYLGSETFTKSTQLLG